MEPGSKFQLDGLTYRVVSIDDADFRAIDAVRVDDYSAFGVTGRGTSPTRQSPVAATPVEAVFLDLPLIRGDEVPYAPYIAIASTPWPGNISIWSASAGGSFALNATVDSPGVIGVTESPLAKFRSDLWDRGSVLTVRIGGGELTAVAEDLILNGANLAAIGPGTSGDFELLQFSSATLVGDGIYELRGFLRGIGGTDAVMPELHPVGSTFVLVGVGSRQIDLPLNLIGLSRDYKIGRSELGYSDANVITMTETFSGVGLRPYSVCHVVGQWDLAGDLHVGWKRRTRIGGDSWELEDVMLGEDVESYVVRVRVGETILRQEEVATPSWTYSVGSQLEDGIVGSFFVDVGQRSAVLGAGPLVSLALSV